MLLFICFHAYKNICHASFISTCSHINLNAKAYNSKDSSNSFVKQALEVTSADHSRYKETIVVKYGGNAMTSRELERYFFDDVVYLQNFGVRIVVVHGGGPQIKKMLERFGVESCFEGGMRISSPEVVEVAEMVLCGHINKYISSGICSSGGNSLGISGRDANILRCKKLLGSNGFDLGNVGEIVSVNIKILENIMQLGIIPVIAPIGTGIGDESNVIYNCNADTVAGRIAGELKASSVIFLTNIAGVLTKEKKLLNHLSFKDVEGLKNDGTIRGGMIPKVSCAIEAIKMGVNNVVIADGRTPHALLNQIPCAGEKYNTFRRGGTVISL